MSLTIDEVFESEEVVDQSERVAGTVGLLQVQLVVLVSRHEGLLYGVHIDKGEAEAHAQAERDHLQ